MNSKKILLLNQGKTENLGDKAIDIVIQEILKTKDIKVISKGFAQTREQHILNFDSSYKVSNKKFFKKFIPRWFIWIIKYYEMIKKEYASISNENFDLVIIGGGQLIKSKSMFMYTLLNWISLLKRNNKNLPIVILGVGLDPKYSFLEKKIYKKVFSEITDFYLRDQQSKKTLKKVFGLNSKYIPDVVFAYKKYLLNDQINLNIKEKNELALMIYEYGTLKNHFGTPLSKEEYYEEWYKLALDNCSDIKNIFLSYTTIGDKRETLEFKKYIYKNHHVDLQIHYTDTLSDLDDIFEKSYKVISGRMHGMLIALNHDCSVVPYIVSPKIQSFKKDYLEGSKSIHDLSLEIESTFENIISKI